MRDFGLNSTMQTLELMRLNDQISDMREGRPPRRGPPNDVGPGCLLKFMALAAVIVLIVYCLGRDRASDEAREQPSPEPPKAETGSTSSEPAIAQAEDSDPKTEPARLWTDVSGEYRVEATLVDCTADTVFLQKANGRIVRVAIAGLCPADREYVRVYSKPVSFR
jgi:hypothetical protein